jgi:NDP-sugar pyrophosphorylase family protein
MEPNLVILAGGISSRMKKPGTQGLDPRLASDADAKSKSMIGLGPGNRPFLDYLLFNAREAGYRDVVIVVGEKDNSIRSYYGVEDRKNQFDGLQISYAVQPIPPGRTKPLGTADALLHGLKARHDWQGQHLTVCNSDNLYSQSVLRRLREEPSGCAMIDYDRDALAFPADRVAAYAVTVKDSRGTLVEIIEKPSPEDMERSRDSAGKIGVSMNIWRFPYDWILPCLEEVPLHPVRQEKELPAAAIMLQKRHPGSLRAIPAAEHVLDLTNRDDIVEVQNYLARAYPDFSFGSTVRAFRRPGL